MSNVIKNCREKEFEQLAQRFEMNEIEANCKEILASAHEEVEGLLRQARLSAEEIRDRAYQEGWEVGRREATERLEPEIRDGLTRKYANQVEQLITSLRHLISDLDGRREPLLKTTRDDLLNLALRIAQIIVKKEVALPGEVAGLNLEHAVACSARRTQLLALVSQQDIDMLQQVLPRMNELAGPNSVVKFIADPDIMPGGCLVRSDRGEVDATVETQFAEIEQTLLGETDDGSAN